MAGDAPKVWFSNGSAPTARRGLQLALRTDSARRTVQPGERWTVWVKTHTGNLSKLKGVDPDCDVYDLAELWAGKFELSMHTTGVTLRVVKCGPGVPDEKEEAAAKHRKPLEPRLTLRVAGLADGSSLLADVDPAQAGPEGACGCVRPHPQAKPIEHRCVVSRARIRSAPPQRRPATSWLSASHAWSCSSSSSSGNMARTCFLPPRWRRRTATPCTTAASFRLPQ